MHKLLVTIGILTCIFYSYAQWNITFDQYYSSQGVSIMNIENSDENLVLFKAKYENIIGYNIFLINISNSGIINNISTIGDPSIKETAISIYSIGEENYVISAQELETGKLLIYKVDKTGNTFWRKTYGDSDGSNWVTDFRLLPNGNFLITSTTVDHCEYRDVLFLKLNPNDGGILWSKILHSDKSYNWPKLFDHENGGYVLISDFREDGNYNKVIVNVLDEDFNSIDEKIFSSDDNYLTIMDVKKVSDNGYVAIGMRRDQWARYTSWFILKLNSQFEEVWRKILYNDIEWTSSVAHSVIESSDSNYVIVGERYQEGNMGSGLLIADYAVTKLNETGDIIWEVSISDNEMQKRAYFIMETENEDYITTGFTNGSWLKSDAYIMTIDEDGNHNVNIDDLNSLDISNYELKQNYPNPFNPETTIEYSIKESANIRILIYNVLGEKIYNSRTHLKNTGIHKQIFDSSKFNSGVYYYSLEINGIKIDTKSMILIK